MNITTILKQLLLILGMVSILILPSLLFVSIAQGEDDSNGGSVPSASERLEGVGEGGGYAEANAAKFSAILGTAVNVFLGLLGIIFIILIIIGGTRYMTASGNEERAKSALSMIRHAVIGLIIIVGAYAIWQFLFNQFILGG